MSRIEDGWAVEAGLVERLSKVSAVLTYFSGDPTVADEAAAEITRLRAEVEHWKRQAEAAQNNATLFQQGCALHVAEKRRKDDALKPFAEDAAQWDFSPECDEGHPIGWDSQLTVSDLRRARAALSNSSQAEGQTP